MKTAGPLFRAINKIWFYSDPGGWVRNKRPNDIATHHEA
jgi:hypothetical protein